MKEGTPAPQAPCHDERFGHQTQPEPRQLRFCLCVAFSRDADAQWSLGVTLNHHLLNRGHNAVFTEAEQQGYKRFSSQGVNYGLIVQMLVNPGSGLEEDWGFITDLPWGKRLCSPKWPQCPLPSCLRSHSGTLAGAEVSVPSL